MFFKLKIYNAFVHLGVKLSKSDIYFGSFFMKVLNFRYINQNNSRF